MYHLISSANTIDKKRWWNRNMLDKRPDIKLHGANIGPIWDRQDPGGSHVGPMNFAVWVTLNYSYIGHYKIVLSMVFFNSACDELDIYKGLVNFFVIPVLPAWWRTTNKRSQAQCFRCPGFAIFQGEYFFATISGPSPCLWISVLRALNTHTIMKLLNHEHTHYTSAIYGFHDNWCVCVKCYTD